MRVTYKVTLSDSDSKFVAGDYSCANRSQKMWSGSDNTFGIPGDIYLCVWYIKEALHVIKNNLHFPDNDHLFTDVIQLLMAETSNYYSQSVTHLK